MLLRDRVNEDVKAAMKAREAERLGTLRLLTAAMKQREVDERIVRDDTRVLAILDKMARQRRESIAQFESGGRQDLVDVQNAELAIIQEFMPQALSEAEIDALIEGALQSYGAASIDEGVKIDADKALEQMGIPEKAPLDNPTLTVPASGETGKKP